jgi:putative flippase GtrA
MVQFIKFCLVGLLNMAFGVGVYCLFVWMGMDYKLATLLSTVLGVVWNFKTTGALVFKNRENRLFVRFVVCYVFLYGVNIASVWLLKSFGANDYLAGIVAAPVIAVISFFLLRKVVYCNGK